MTTASAAVAGGATPAGANNAPAVTPVMRSMMRYLLSHALNVEGVFRRLPSDSARLQELKAAAVRGELGELDRIEDRHLVAALFVHHLRELSEPLLTWEFYEEFVSAMDLEPAARVATCRDLIQHLPNGHKALVEVLLLFLSRVAEKAAANKMGVENLALIFAPIFLRPKQETIESMGNAPKVTLLTQFLINEFEKLFPPTARKVSSNVSPLNPAASRLAVSGTGAGSGGGGAGGGGLNSSAPSAVPNTASSSSSAAGKAAATTSPVGSLISRSEDGSAAAAAAATPMTREQQLTRVKGTVDEAIVAVLDKLDALKTNLDNMSPSEVADTLKRLKQMQAVLGTSAQAMAAAAAAAAAPAKAAARRLVFRSGFESIQGRRKTMEDAHELHDRLHEHLPNQISDDLGCAYYGVYDGHGGSEVAELTEKLLLKNIVDDPAFSEGKIDTAMFNAFFRTDRAIIETSLKEGYKCGTTVVSTFFIGRRLFVANVGDSEAVLGKRLENGALEPEVLSFKHSPNDPAEKARIEAAGGLVFHGRLFGSLAVARSFGDCDYKKPQSDDYLTPEPFQSKVEIQDYHEFLVLACDGLYERLVYQEVVDMTVALRKQGKSPQEVAQALVKESYDRGSQDNITTVVVYFDWE